MNRYTTKHFWRMKESEQGEWVRYEDYKDETERLRMERDSYRDMYKDTLNNYCAMTKKYHEEQNLTDHYRFRVRVLTGVLIANFIVFVAEFIGWSLGL